MYTWRPSSQVERFDYLCGLADGAEGTAGGERSGGTAGMKG